MLNVALDTNILHKAQNFSSTEIRKLISLVQSQVIRLYIPEVVLREFKSKKEAEYKKLVSEQEKSLSALSKISTSLNDSSVLSKMNSDFSSIKNSLLKSFEKQIADFIKITNLQIVKNTPDDLNKMWDLYFAGELPFKNIKNRQDIPDCFIYIAIKTIPAPHTICNDNALKAALEKDGLPTYESIDEFIVKNEKLLKQLATYKKLQKESRKIINFLLNEVGVIKKLMVKQLEKRLEYQTFTDEKIESDDNEATIEGSPSISENDIEIDEKSIDHDGHGFFSFDFKCEFQNPVDYYIFKADYYCKGAEEFEGVSIEDWNEDYFLAEEDMTIKCTGTVTIQVLIDDEEFYENNYMLTEEDISFDYLELSVE